mmetsp:Transcript_46424/g.90675  ORF Transcript_46424/g.90675 Transcript_46424/m.90675 type:complete len:548 (-) Transcript_46424:457-2100(-)
MLQYVQLQLLFLSLYIKKQHAAIAKTSDGRSKINEVSKRQNIILILIDDLGIKDLGCYGSKFYSTPHINTLSREGVKFVNAYAAHPMCLPSRVALLSGVYPARFGQNDGQKEFEKYGHLKAKKCFGKFGANIFSDDLPTNQAFTLGEAFKEHGYQTAWLGKWHLGRPPTDHGFDRAFGHTSIGSIQSHFAPYFRPGHEKNNLWDLEKENIKKGTYMADLLTTKTIDAMTDFRSGQKKEKPFFVVLSHYAVHSPLEGPKQFHGTFEKKLTSMSPGQKYRFDFDREAVCKTSQDNTEYAAMLKSVDESVGRVRAFLEADGLKESTTIVFTSDNGGESTKPTDYGKMSPKNIVKEHINTSNSPYRGGKFWLYEGGIRVPLIIYSANKQKSRHVTQFRSIGMDIYPTLLDLAGLPLYPSVHRDGISLVPALTKLSKTWHRKEPFFWNYPKVYDGGEGICSAALKGAFKVIQFRGPKSDGFSHTTELYNILSDPSEQINIAAEQPKKVQELLGELLFWKENWVDDEDFTTEKCKEFLKYDQWKDVTNSTGTY